MDNEAGGRTQSDSWQVKVTGRASGRRCRKTYKKRRQTGAKAATKTPRRRISQSREQQSNTRPLMWEARQSVLYTHPGRRAPPLMLWRGGVVSRCRELLIRRGGGVLMLTSMQPKKKRKNAAASSGLPGAALPGGFKGRQPDFSDMPDSLIFKNVFDFALER